jgi:hypothetical protein
LSPWFGPANFLELNPGGSKASCTNDIYINEEYFSLSKQEKGRQEPVGPSTYILLLWDEIQVNLNRN